MASLKNTTVAGTDSIQLPVGTTAQRPGSPVTADMRFNSTFKVVEHYDGSAWKYLPPVIENGLVLRLDAAEPASYPGSGTSWNDLSSEGNDATLINGPTYSSTDGGYLNFDGSNDRGEISNDSSLNPSSITVAVWLNPDTSQTGNLVSKDFNSNYRLRVGGGVAQFLDRGATNILTSRSSVSNNAWIYLVATGNANSTALYINGVLDNQNNTAYGGSVTSGAVLIGVGTATPTEPFDGKISSVQIYNRALTPQEILQNFNATRGRYGI